MSEFEYIMACLLIPIVYVVTYIAGKYDLITLICKMLERKCEEYLERNDGDTSA